MIVFKSIDSGQLEMEMSAKTPESTVTFKLPASSCDPLVELPETIIKIAALYTPEGELTGKNEKFFTFWEAEKQMYTCMFVPEDNQLVRVEMSCCNDIYAGIHTHDEIKFSTTITLRELAANVYEEMKFLIRHCGFAGYREKWGKNGFPVDLFIRLHYWLENGDVRKKSLKDELQTLTAIFSGDNA